MYCYTFRFYPVSSPFLLLPVSYSHIMECLFICHIYLLEFEITTFLQILLALP
jgi:hypothetical protein